MGYTDQLIRPPSLPVFSRTDWVYTRLRFLKNAVQKFMLLLVMHPWIFECSNSNGSGLEVSKAASYCDFERTHGGIGAREGFKLVLHRSSVRGGGCSVTGVTRVACVESETRGLMKFLACRVAPLIAGIEGPRPMRVGLRERAHQFCPVAARRPYLPFRSHPIPVVLTALAVQRSSVVRVVAGNGEPKT